VSPAAWQAETGLPIDWLALAVAAAVGAFVVLGFDRWAQARQTAA
jgi:hypothetical protein